MDLNYKKSIASSNIVDEYIIKNGKEFINMGELSINHVLKSNYMDLIKRSMRNYEVCLVRVDQGNLKKTDSGLNIGSIKYLTYNLIENDLYSYIKRIRRRNSDIDLESLIVSYVQKSLLNNDSIEYLKGLASYPFETLKVWDKYLRGRDLLTEDEYIDLFSKAKIIDGKSIII